MNYVKTINRIADSGTARYRGLNLKRKDGFWICLGEKCPTLKEVDSAINKAASVIEKSITKPINTVTNAH